MEIFDISQRLCPGIANWPGDPEFRHRWAMRIGEGGASNVSAVDMCVHTGTHVDAPLHLDNAGCDIAGVPLDPFIGPARVLAIPSEKSIRVSDLSGLDWTNVKRILFKTCSRCLPERLFDENFVFLEENAAGFLAGKGIRLVGTDAPSVDDFRSADLPSHRILLRNGIVILEGARLEHVPPGDYELVCLPLKLAGLDGSPVRAILRR
ncbi:MAG TPA: cyclase family protein [Acidobacteriota bacterium]|nr:cyclase family protein [Acidobacteriota bacterium]